MSDTPNKPLGIIYLASKFVRRFPFAVMGMALILLVPAYAIILDYTQYGIRRGVFDTSQLAPFFYPQYLWFQSRSGQGSAAACAAIGLCLIAGSLVEWRSNRRAD